MTSSTFSRVSTPAGPVAGGIAYLMKSGHGINLPRRLQSDFGRHVQRHADASGAEMTAPQIWDLFVSGYLARPESGADVDVVSFGFSDTAGFSGAVGSCSLVLAVDGIEYTVDYHGADPVQALIAALANAGIAVDVLSVAHTPVKTGRGGSVLSFVEYRDDDGTHWAAGRDRTTLTATVSAVVNAARRTTRQASSRPHLVP